MMKIFNFILYYEFIIFTANHLANADPYEKVKFTIIPENGEPIISHLKQVESYLANENLPIWTITQTIFSKLRLQKVNSTVMQDLGRFTMYQDSDTSSAAVYFHKRREFDGIIDIRYIIKEHSVRDNIYKTKQIGIHKDHTVFERQQWGHSIKPPTQNLNLNLPNHFSEWIGEKLPNQYNSLGIKSTRHNPDMFYIETLVVVHDDVARDILTADGGGYVSLVSYLLTFFHSTDMLFSKIHSPKIKINIAGIIVGFEENSYSFLTECYNKNHRFVIERNVMQAECVNEKISNFLLTQNHIIPPDSYDIVVFLTKRPLRKTVYNQLTHRYEFMYVTGLATCPLAGIYEHKRRDDALKLGICIRDIEDFGSFAIAAHEIAHSIGFHDHDKQCTTKNGTCSEKIMKPMDGFCEHCLDWSDYTRTELNSYLRSPDGCIFKNEPRSLYPPGPRLTLTADEQCQCYNYESAYKYETKFWDKIRNPFSGYCGTLAQCKDKDGGRHIVPVPMDGTLCNEDNETPKVCWNRKCTAIENSVSE